MLPLCLRGWGVSCRNVKCCSAILRHGRGQKQTESLRGHRSTSESKQLYLGTAIISCIGGFWTGWWTQCQISKLLLFVLFFLRGGRGGWLFLWAKKTKTKQKPFCWLVCCDSENLSLKTVYVLCVEWVGICKISDHLTFSKQILFCVRGGKGHQKRRKKKKEIITEFDFFFLSWSVKLGYIFKERRALENYINAIATGSTYLKDF